MCIRENVAAGLLEPCQGIVLFMAQQLILMAEHDTRSVPLKLTAGADYRCTTTFSGHTWIRQLSVFTTISISLITVCHLLTRTKPVWCVLSNVDRYSTCILDAEMLYAVGMTL